MADTSWIIPAQFDTCFDADYGRSLQADEASKLEALYRKSQASQWDASTRIDWSENIDFENPLGYDDRFIPIWGSTQWTQATSTQQADMRRNYHAYTVSQFLHGEQAAMLAAARMVEVMPDIASKQFAASQAADEARHVEIFKRLAVEKIGIDFPIDDGVKNLIQQGLSDSRWDMVVLTTQIMIEGLALIALKQLRDFSKHKLINQIGSYILADEARHVAFGIQILEPIYKNMYRSQLIERREFVDAGLDVLTQRLNPLLHSNRSTCNVDTSANTQLLKRRLVSNVKAIVGKLLIYEDRELQYAKI